MTEHPDVLVVGAGIAGLAAATWLTEQGMRVKVVEASDRPGGRAVTVARPGSNTDRVDVGTQYYHSNYRRALSLIETAGLTQSLRKVHGKTRFFDDRAKGGSFVTGHRTPYIGAISPLANLRIFLRGAIRTLGNWIDPYGVHPYPRLDGISVKQAVTDPAEWEFTARSLISVGSLVEPDMGEDVSYLHLVRLMWIIFVTDYLVLDGGVASLHEALAERLDITYQTPAARLIWDGRARGVEMADGSVAEADHVILATPPAAMATLLPTDWEERDFLQGIHHPPVTVVTLFLDGPLEAGVWSYVFPADPQRLVSFCSNAAAKAPGMAQSGKAALQAWILHPAAGRAAETSDESLTQAVLTELSPHFDSLRSRVEASHVQRHARSVPQCPPGHAQAADRVLTAIDGRSGLQVCGDFLSGGYMECALWSAERAVGRVVAERSDA